MYTRVVWVSCETTAYGIPPLYMWSQGRANIGSSGHDPPKIFKVKRRRLILNASVVLDYSL